MVWKPTLTRNSAGIVAGLSSQALSASKRDCIQSNDNFRIDIGPFDFGADDDTSHLFPSNFRYSVMLFLIGTILAFFTPIGGVLQFIGSLGFMLTASTTSFAGVELIFWIGAAMGLFASVMVLLSLVAQIGVGYEKEKTNAISRLLTISVYR